MITIQIIILNSYKKKNYRIIFNLFFVYLVVWKILCQIVVLNQKECIQYSYKLKFSMRNSFNLIILIHKNAHGGDRVGRRTIIFVHCGIRTGVANYFNAMHQKLPFFFFNLAIKY